jgi:hypothetical protein
MREVIRGGPPMPNAGGRLVWSEKLYRMPVRSDFGMV